MTQLISASFDTLLTQAGDTAAYFMSRADVAIDRLYGEGYAKTHPELVAAFMRVAVDDFRTSSSLKVAEAAGSAKEQLEFIGHSINCLGEDICAALREEPPEYD